MGQVKAWAAEKSSDSSMYNYNYLIRLYKEFMSFSVLNGENVPILQKFQLCKPLARNLKMWT